VLEEEYWHLMEQSFLLKHYGHLDINEQLSMTAEDRTWWLKRIDKEHQKERDASHKQASTPGKIPQSPGAPPK
jgi:hypothetical protein